MTDATPETQRICKTCNETKPVFFFKMSRRIRNTTKLTATCLECREHRRETEIFKCNQCDVERIGTEFYSGHGTPVSQPCLHCRKEGFAENAIKNAEARAARGREPVHKILAETINVKSETGTCSVCGPTELRRVIQAATQNVNWRCFTYTAKYEMSKRPKAKGFVEKKVRHFISNKDMDLMEADCKACESRVKIKLNKTDGYARCANAQRNHLFSKYGIDAATYMSMFNEQNGVCAICLEPGDPLCVDHDHVSGQVRFLLCRGCNLGIGGLKDDPDVIERAANLIRKAREMDPFYVDRNEDVQQDAWVGSIDGFRAGRD